MMNCTCYRLAMAAVAANLSMIATSVEAATMVNRNGVIWDYTFEGDVADLTTSSPAWSVFDRNGFAAESTDGNIYSYVSGSVGTTVSYTAPNWDTFGTARTAEIRVRVPNDDFLASDGAAAFVASNVNAYDLRIYHDRLAYNGTGGVIDPANIINIDMTQFRTLRAVVDTSAPFVYSLYIDNNPAPVLQRNDFWFANFTPLLFGDLSTGGISGRVDVDYISWADGAFAPIPEPASLVLLGMSGLALLIRRTRNL
jgi:hypothetical protein